LNNGRSGDCPETVCIPLRTPNLLGFRRNERERIGDGECASNDTLRSLIETFSIGVYRRLKIFLAWSSCSAGVLEENQPPM
jgi:hypothetical protein